VEEAFHEIEEGDTVRFSYMSVSNDYTVEMINGMVEDKSI